jgi:hypothetical protein
MQITCQLQEAGQRLAGDEARRRTVKGQVMRRFGSSGAGEPTSGDADAVPDEGSRLRTSDTMNIALAKMGVEAMVQVERSGLLLRSRAAPAHERRDPRRSGHFPSCLYRPARATAASARARPSKQTGRQDALL